MGNHTSTIYYLHGSASKLREVISTISTLGGNIQQRVSIYINSQAHNPALRKTLSTRIKNAFRKATKTAYSQWEEIASLVAAKTAALPTLSQAIAIFATPDEYMLLLLPEEVEEIALLDKFFYIKPLVRLSLKFTPYWLLLLTSENVYLWKGWNTSIYPHENDGVLACLPDKSIVTADVATLGTRADDITTWKERESEAMFATAMKQFARLSAHSTDIPLVIVGNPKELGILKKHLHNYPEEHIITIEADANPSTLNTLLPRINSALRHWKEKLEEKLIATIERAFKMRRVAAGINEVWQALAHNRIDTLLIEENFKLQAWTTELPIPTVYLQEPPPDIHTTYHPDLVDHMTELALKQGVQVHLLKEGKLSTWDRIVALLRY